MRCLIDGDILVYRVAFTTETEEVELAQWRIDDLIEKILADVEATSFALYLTASNDSTAFRRKVYPEYKANRKQQKPTHYQALREHLVEKWNAEIVSCIEADDALGINQTKESIIVSIDKDLDMIQGWHYNFVKEQKYFVFEDQAIYNFYRQCLTGDTADNIKGVQRIGQKKAEKLLGEVGYKTEEELFNIVRETYNDDYEFYVNSECLWILREPYPSGRFSYTTLGSLLLPEVEQRLGLLSSQEQACMESTGVETQTDGFLPNGASQVGTSDLTEERLT